MHDILYTKYVCTPVISTYNSTVSTLHGFNRARLHMHTHCRHSVQLSSLSLTVVELQSSPWRRRARPPMRAPRQGRAAVPPRWASTTSSGFWEMAMTLAVRQLVSAPCQTSRQTRSQRPSSPSAAGVGAPAWSAPTIPRASSMAACACFCPVSASRPAKTESQLTVLCLYGVE